MLQSKYFRTEVALHDWAMQVHDTSGQSGVPPLDCRYLLGVHFFSLSLGGGRRAVAARRSVDHRCARAVSHTGDYALHSAEQPGSQVLDRVHNWLLRAGCAS